MAEYSFVVTVVSYDHDEPVTSGVIRNSLMYGGYGWRNVVARRYDPESEARTAKIPAIKRIRALLDCTLRDAKFLTDVAEESGTSAWSTVAVDYKPGEGFRVIDNSYS